MSRRVVVTGMGGITPIGNSIKDFWYNVKEGNSGIDTITAFDTAEHKTTIAAEVKDFDPAQYMDARVARRNDPFSQYAIAASVEAIENAQVSDTNCDPERIATILGVGMGGFYAIETAVELMIERGPKRTSPFIIPKMIPNIAPGQLAIMYNLRGPSYSIASACASGTDAIINSFDGIVANRFDMAVTGGVEAPIVRLSIAGFNALQALSTNYNDNPKMASRPFDAKRDGFVIGSGSVIVVLEELEHAKQRGATIYGEIVGGAATNDAFHITAPHDEGIGIIKSMQLAMSAAGVTPQEIGYINAHGTSTKINDRVETHSIKKVFGDHASKVSISSTKSVHGHMIGATGAAEAVVCIKAVQEGFIPPTINYEYPDPDCDLDYTPNVGKPKDITYAMSNSLGFGGHNSSLIIKKYEG